MFLNIRPKNNLKKAVENKNEKQLIKCLVLKQKNKVDKNQYYLIVEALIGTWHSQHEDLVGTIYLEDLKDDRFIEPILNIAFNKDEFRWYDDELESTLRKCVHALKTISSKEADKALEKLKKLNNQNIKSVLEMY